MTVRPLRLLLVGDDRAALRDWSQWLDALGCQTTQACGSKHVEAVAGGEPFDVVIVDDRVSSGALDLCRRLASEPASRRAALLLVTDAGRRDAVEQAIAAGVDDFLTRPCRGGQWPARVRAAARLAELRHRLLLHFGRDPETGLLNEAACNDALADRLSGTAPRGCSFGLAAIDHLSAVEQCAGRHGVKAAIRRWAERFSASAGQGALVFRVSENRFAWIADPTADAEAYFHAVREAAEGDTFSFGWLRSAGVAEPSRLWAAAEAALAQVRQGGGDGVVQGKLGTSPAASLSLLHLLQSARAVDLMSPCAVVLGTDTPLAEARRLFTESSLAAVVIVDPRGEVAGILERDTLPLWPEGNALTAADCMERVVALAEDTPFPEVMESFTQHGLAVAVVLKNQHPIGLIQSESLMGFTEPLAHESFVGPTPTTRPGRYLCVPELAVMEELGA